METYHPSGANPKLHGNSGPLHVSSGGHRSRLGDQFLEATKKCYDVPSTDDNCKILKQATTDESQ